MIVKQTVRLSRTAMSTCELFDVGVCGTFLGKHYYSNSVYLSKELVEKVGLALP